ncbi:MAG: hypothetical protein GF330_08380 [Candidatus Eisenbacteria bacterium]|nr:hypothetical protein [Candidatus Eisenbacteria bacterium]
MSAPPAGPRFALVRVDDRLLHGQVVYGWGGALDPRHYYIVDDAAAGDAWTADALRASVEGAAVTVLAVARFAAQWSRLPETERSIVLLRDPETLLRLHDAGFPPSDPVNLGGIRQGPAARAFLPYLQLLPPGVALLCRLLREGVPLFAQDLPGAVRYDAAALAAMLDC